MNNIVDLYDSNNVLRRATERFGMPSVVPMGFRQRYEFTMSKPPGTQIWVWDGKGHNEMRRSIFPDYKTQRTPAAEDIFAQINLWRQVLLLSPAISVTAAGWEADDVIATLALLWAKRGRHVRVHSNDIDYGQLSAYPNIEVIGVNPKDCPPKWLPLRKALVGKASDNMKGIPGFGPKRFDAMQPLFAEIEACIENGDHQRLLSYSEWTPAVKAWLTDAENFEKLQAMLKVSKFFTVPEDEIIAGWKAGTPDRLRAHEIMSEFFL